MIRFYNGKVLSFEAGLKIEDKELWTDGRNISYIGPKPESLPEFEREIDLKGDLMLPGFKNAHTHTAMTFLRSYADDLPLQEWLYNKVFPEEAKLTPEAVYLFTKLGIMEYVSGGITASFDMYYKNDEYIRANRECGFRTVICSALNNFDADIENIEREFLKFNAPGDDMAGYRLGIHAEYTTSMERMEYLSSLVHKYKVPAFTHISETKAETEECIGRYGLTPPQLLDKIGFFDYGGGGFHCTWFNDEDIELFAEKGLWAVANPASNLKLASGIAPLEKMRKAGVNLAIGTDGPASNNALDMFREMYLACVTQKHICEDAAAFNADFALEMACKNGADCLDLPQCDDLSVGKRADLTVINLRMPNMQPLHNISKNIVFAGSKENVRLTMINGKILYEDGQYFLGFEPEDLYREVNAYVQAEMKN